MENKLQEYNGIWWAWFPQWGVWCLSEKEDYSYCGVGYYSSHYLITEAFDHFKKEFYGK